MPDQGPTQTLTGVGISCLEICGEHHCKVAVDGANWFFDDPLRLTANNFYYGVYFTGVGMSRMGGKHADASRKHLTTLMLWLQDSSGRWVPRQGAEEAAGPVYGTALAVMGLTAAMQVVPAVEK